MKLSSLSIGYSFLHQLTGMGFQFAAFLVLVRVLSTEDLGIWTIYLAVHALLETGKNGFVHNGLVKYLVSDHQDSPTLLATGFWLHIFLGVVASILFAGVALGVASYWEADNMAELAWGYPLVTIGSSLFQVLISYHIAKKEFRTIWLAVLIQSLIYFTGTVVFIFAGDQTGLWLMLLFQAAGFLVAGFWLFAPVFRAKLFGHFDVAWLSRLFHFGKFTLGSSLGSIFYHKMDLFMVGYFLHPEAVAVYGVATRVNNYLEVPMNALAQVSFPNLTEKLRQSDSEGAVELAEGAIAWMLGAIIPIFLMVMILPGFIIKVIAGPEYLEATILLQIFAFVALIKPFGRVFGITLDALGLPQINFKLLWISVLVNLVLNTLLIGQYGLVGAAIATLVATWLTILGGQLYLRKRLRLRYGQSISGIWPVYRLLWKQGKQFVNKRLQTQ